MTARVDLAAVSLAHGRVLARLLRAKGHAQDADGLDAALATAFHLLADQVGRAALTDATERLDAELGESEGRFRRHALRH